MNRDQSDEIQGRLCPLEENAAKCPGTPALEGPGGSYPYREYAGHVAAVARNLEASGIQRGDVLGISLAASEVYPILLMACFRAGVVACPLDPRLPVQALRDSLKLVRCKALLTSESGSGITTELDFPTLSLGDVVSETPVTCPDRKPIPPDQSAVIVFTSGSSGRPKGALLSYGNLYVSAALANEVIAVRQGDRWLLSLPLYHVSGLGIVLRCLLGQGTVVVAGADEHLLAAIRTREITHLSVVSTQLHRLLEADPRGDVLGRLKAILLGGGPIPERLVHRAAACNLALHTTYGLTETASQVTTTRKGDGLQALSTSGKPLRPNTITIREGGEILVRGDTLFKGYVQGHRLELPLTHDGWFATGDLGSFDADGNLRVAGRKDNLFVSAGENIQPEEIERHIINLPGIAGALVVAVEDAEFGCIPVAFVETEPGVAVDQEAIVQALGNRLPRFKIPRMFYAWPSEWPSSGMKTDRKAFAALARRLSQTAQCRKQKERRNP